MQKATQELKASVFSVGHIGHTELGLTVLNVIKLAERLTVALRLVQHISIGYKHLLKCILIGDLMQLVFFGRCC